MSNEELTEVLVANCYSYISVLRKCNPGDILLRGSFRNITSMMKFKHNLNHRKPLHTPENIHNLVNDSFEKMFGWKIRNGAFCYGFNLHTIEKPKDLGYGSFYIFFPIGNFSIAFSPTMFDMFGYISTVRTAVEELITKMDFEDSLCRAIASGERKHENVSNEISVRTDAYYLLNLSYSQLILRLIWG